jgi:branched-chain amino acid transport system substrate-binding protein
MTKRRSLSVFKRIKVAAALLAATSLLLSGCAASDTGSGTGDTITIGASLPLTGPLQAFGTSLQTGYQAAVDEVNAEGGLDFGGAKHQVELVIQDNASDGDKASQQAKSLVLDSGAVALLGPATPPLTIPVSAVAEQLQVPLLSTITPIKGWLSGTKDGYKYSWDTFFDEVQMTQTQYQAADLTATNKKVVIFTDTEEDGPIQAGLWKENATKYGYTVAQHIEFPVGNTNFTSQVKQAKESGADIVLAQIIPPDGVALLKEMKAQGYAPKLLFMEKAGNTGGYVDITEGLADGVLSANWFAEGMGLDREADFITKYTEAAGGKNSNLGTIINGYSIAKVLLDAIKTAGSTEPEAVNTAIGATDATYPMGHIKFDETHAAPINVVQTQWNGKDQILVLTQDGKAANPITTPVAGLK